MTCSQKMLKLVAVIVRRKPGKIKVWTCEPYVMSWICPRLCSISSLYSQVCQFSIVLNSIRLDLHQCLLNSVLLRRPEAAVQCLCTLLGTFEPILPIFNIFWLNCCLFWLDFYKYWLIWILWRGPEAAVHAHGLF